MCKYWGTPSELGSVVSRSMVKLMKSTHAIGWIRADDINDPEMSKENLALREQIEELENEINSIGDTSTKGIEQLSQGEDEYELKFRMISSRQKGGYEWQREPQGVKYEMNVTWNKIAKVVLPQCLPECSEKMIIDSIEKKLC